MTASVPVPIAAAADTSLHILCVDHAFRDGSRPGPTRTRDFAARVAAHGYRVTVLTTTWGWTPPPDRQRGTVICTKDGIDLCACRAPLSTGWEPPPKILSRFVRWAAWRIWRVRDVDALIVSTASYGFLAIAALFAWTRGIPLLADAYLRVPDSPPPGAIMRERLAATLGQWCRRILLKLPHRVFVASPAIGETLTGAGVAAERQIQVPFGCDTQLFAFPTGKDNDFLQEFPDLAGHPLLVFAGRFTDDRDLVAVVNLAAALKTAAPEVIVVLCGDGPTRAALIEHARRVDVLDTNLRVVHILPRNGLPDLLAAAGMVLSVPRRIDTAGGFFDALAAGKPVLALGRGWQRTLVETRGAGFGLPHGDPHAVAKEIAEILGNSDGLRRAGQQASALAAGRFNLDRVIGEQRLAIESLVAERPRAEIMRRRTLTAKRAMDIIVSAILIIALAPLLLGLWAAVAVILGWPAVISEECVGLRGRHLWKLRFRTERVNADTDAPAVDRFGRFLVRSGLHALPDLFNVLIGAMSLVGPHPLLATYLAFYTAAQQRRHDVRPGITGLAQVDGHNAATWEEILALDADYVDRISLRLDCRIMIHALYQTLRGTHDSGTRKLPPFDLVMAHREGAEDV